MKRKKFCKVLKSLGFSIVRHGKHEIWGDGRQHVAVPGGTEVHKMICRRLIKEIKEGRNLLTSESA